MAVQISPVRDMYGSLVIHQNRIPSPEVRSPSWGETSRISGRLADHMRIAPGITGAHHLATSSNPGSRLGGEHGKVRYDSVQVSGLPLSKHQHRDGSCLPLPLQGQKLAGNQFHLHRNTLATSSRLSNLSREISPLRSSQDQTHTMESETVLANGARLQKQVDSNQLGYERIYPPNQRCAAGNCPDRPLYIHGQQLDRLGIIQR